MANYYANARSNYFKVKDQDAFKAAMEPFDVEVWVNVNDPAFVAVGCVGGNECGWPSSRYDEELDDYLDEDFPSLIAEHLADDEVAVLQEVGAEKLRYLTGYAVAVNNKNEQIIISLDEIYERAKPLGSNITDASY